MRWTHKEHYSVLLDDGYVIAHIRQQHPSWSGERTRKTWECWRCVGSMPHGRVMDSRNECIEDLYEDFKKFAPEFYERLPRRRKVKD
jgi:hypothetical protein